jgi:hypothetical protein
MIPGAESAGRAARRQTTEEDGMSEARKDRLPEAIIACEEEAWRALSEGSGADFYRANLTDDALMVFPSGVLSRVEAIAGIEAAPPWSTFRIEQPRVQRLGDDRALLTYRATAQRAGQKPYRALMTTLFVRQDGTWKTEFHQQTPTGC